MKYIRKTKEIITKSSLKSEKDGRLSLGRQKEDVIFPVAPLSTVMPKSYASFLSNLKTRIRQERLRVVLASNAALVNLYWDIGSGILKKQKEETLKKLPLL